MAVPAGKRSQLIRDMARELPILSTTDKELRRYLSPEMGGLNVKQNEGILALVGMVEKVVMALVALNNEMEAFVVGDRSIEIKAGETSITLNQTGSVLLKAGDATITLFKDGSMVLKGKHLRIEGSGDVTIRASKDLIMKGQKILQN